MPTRLVSLACAALAVALAAGVAAAASGPARTERVSVSSHGRQAERASYGPALSNSGRYAAFMSYSHRLVPHDTNNDADIFVHDLSTGATKRVSVSSKGRQANGRSEWADISASGRFVSFESRADNLARGDGNKRYDVFVRDLERNRTVLASITPSGTHGGATPSLSANGRFVVFAGLDKNGATGEIFVRDLKRHHTRRVTESGGGPSISGDGRMVAFGSDSGLSVRDMKTGKTELVATSSRPGGFIDRASISADGRYVAFADTGDIFRRDLKTKSTEQISVNDSGEPANRGSSAPAISANGRHVAFTSFASNLVPGDTNEEYGTPVLDIFVRDVEWKTTTRVSVGDDGQQSNSHSQGAAISGDGRFAAFQSQATNLDGDTNGKWNIFERGPLRP